MAFCSQCGSSIDDNATFCPNCGAAVNNAQTGAQTSQPMPNGQEKTSTGCVVAIVVFFVIIFLFVGIMAAFMAMDGDFWLLYWLDDWLYWIS